MKIFALPRRCGKTLTAISLAQQKKAIIICANQALASFTEKTAKDLGYVIKKPMTFKKFIKTPKIKEPLIFDDIDFILGKLVGSYEKIVAITLTTDDGNELRHIFPTKWSDI